MVNKPILAKYLRLSLEDDKEGESDSIVNQRLLIDDYILQYGDLREYESMEFVDDGYSGTNFSRPAIKELMDLLRKGKIHCIIVKDFSRFSRDYIELGNYLEQVFPFKGVRFISVNDKYDSKSANLMQSGLDVPFKGILYDLYSKDISNKVKSAKRQMLKQGKLAGGSHPYGYIKDKQGKKTYKIDEEAATIIRLIYKLALESKSDIEIAKELNAKKIMTPSLYKKSKGFCAYGVRKGIVPIWDSVKVNKILRDERYTGVLLLGQHKSAGIGTGRTICVPQNEWYRKEDNHPPIVSREQFETVQRLKSPYIEKGKHKVKNILFRKIKCASCGRFLYHKPSDKGKEYNSFFCKQPHICNSLCFKGYIKEKDILDALFGTINVHAGIAAHMEQRQMNDIKAKEDPHRVLKTAEAERDKALEAKSRLYLQYRQGEISKEQFILDKEQISRKAVSLEKEKHNMTKPEETESNLEVDKIHSRLLHLCLPKAEQGAESELTREIIERLVDTIYVYNTTHIRIDLLYKDEYDS